MDILATDSLQDSEICLISRYVDVPKGTVGVDVPVDSALAIANRFGKLAQQEVD